ncbi:sensor histidine kinase [Sphaerochaeta sp. S2]|uniref:sensor histidine kinase n=1 Tax=Sphaerochaeta sp. S2 TaxID=2798868 RepID=UPI0018E96F28|nr:histidine kinase [Sphaerochaeta sp. S2]MBJ2356285.1 histidine kinase [Sphaerochaeta sp. S2]MCK9348341.1 histidine kinase [Sphaerochaeta sp.]
MADTYRYLESRIILIASLFVLHVLLVLAGMFLYLEERIQTPLVLLFSLVSFFILLAFSYWWIVLPYRRTKHIWQLFATGYTFRSIIDEQTPLAKELVSVNRTLQTVLNNDHLMNASKRQAQFLALQNQINPHFLYNTLEGIRSEALLAGLDSVATMTEALSTFFRYTISNVENLVTLGQELENTKNYFFIQQFRFGTRIKLSIVFDEEDTKDLLLYRIPKLTLQPIVENCIIHGLECKVGEGHLLIRLERTQSRLIVTVSDDGVGMDPDMLEKIQRGLNIRSFDYVKREEKESGIALVNVNNRIKLLFGEQYGLTVTSQKQVGTDVIISLPASKQEKAES